MGDLPHDQTGGVHASALLKDLTSFGPGFAPDIDTRNALTGRLGFDPVVARLHTGPYASNTARNLNADAFTIGKDVFFGEGRYDTSSSKGLSLIAHELTHVGQQTGTIGDTARFFTPSGGDIMEREAQSVAQGVLARPALNIKPIVDDYVREYVPLNDTELTAEDISRLDRISMLALHEAEAIVGRLRQVSSDNVRIEIDIDLSTMTDRQAARKWAEAIVESLVVTDEPPMLLSGTPQSEILKSHTNLLHEKNADAIPPVAATGVDNEGNRYATTKNGTPYLVSFAGGTDEKSTGTPNGYPCSGVNINPHLVPLNPAAAFKLLMDHTVRIAGNQEKRADLFKDQKDMKYWFARVYQYVTDAEIAAINAGTYQYPHMKMQEISAFEATYAANINAAKSGNGDHVEPNWKEAFKQAQTGTWTSGEHWYGKTSGLTAIDIKNALLPSMQAHIRFDLPRAISSVFLQHYSGIPGAELKDFEDDFQKMMPVFDTAQARLQPEIDSYSVMQKHEAFMFPYIFDVRKERTATWNKAELIAGEVESGDPSHIEDKIEENPSLYGSTNIGGIVSSHRVLSTAATSYDWLDQPPEDLSAK